MNTNKSETRSVRFKRVAERRTQALLEAIRILGNCANLSNYEYTEDQIAKIFREIEDQLRLTKMKFRRNARRKFSL